jgi:DNA-binding beta-propeller fold protein YncE
MRTAAAAFAILLLSTPVFSQRPSDPALLVPQDAPALEYVAVASPLTFPEGTTIGAAASVAFDPGGHLWVLNRGPQPLAEFDADGKFLRAFGDGMFTRSHGLHIDTDGNLWATDVGGHTVTKLDRQGKVLLTLGTKGQAGTWTDGSQTGLLSEPNDVTVAQNGDIYVVQGHTPGPKGDPRVLRFDRTGRLITSWGGKGKEPGKFDVAHGVAIDAKGMVWVADRENQRVQVFNPDGTFVRQMKYAGLPCGFAVGSQYVYMVNGFAGQVVRMDLDGRVLSVVGKAGQGVGEFGEAHFVAVSPKGDIFVADSVNRAVQKFVRK